MSDLARSFDDVADAYERGRPRYDAERSPRSRPPPAAARACSTSARAPGGSPAAARAGLRRRRGRAAGRHARDPRRHIGAERALAGPPRRCRSPTRASTAPCAATRGTGSTAPAPPTSSRASSGRAAAWSCAHVPALVRQRRRARLVARSRACVHAALPKGDHRPHLTGSRRPDGLEGHPAFEELEPRDEPFVHHTDRERIVAHARVDVVRRDAARGASAPTLLASSTRCSRAAASTRSRSPTGPTLWITRRRPRRAPPRGPRGSGELTSTGAPVTGCAKARRAACRNWRSSPRRPGVAVLGVAGDRVADRLQVRADLVRAPGLQAHAQQRGARQRALELEVRHRRARVVGVGGHPRAHAPVAAERRVDRAAARRRAALDQREVLARDRPRLQRVCAARGARRRERATTSRPDVSRSRRCTMPGARGVLAAGRRPAQRLRERARAVPARRVHDDAGGLVDHEQVLVLVGRPRRARRRAVGRRRLLGLVDRRPARRRSAVALGRRAAVDRAPRRPRSGAARARASPAAPARKRRAARRRPQASLARSHGAGAR